MTDFFPYAIAQVAEAYVSVQRINKFLLYDETTLISNNVDYTEDKKCKVTNTIEFNGIQENNEIKLNGTIILKNVNAKWNNQIAENTLSNININIDSGKLVTIIGPVGSGKTSLLHTILKELPLNDGVIDVNGDVSYSSQEPWLFAGSVKQNILFGQPMNKIRYQRVVHCCALKTDFELLPYRDKTIVGERGVSLSGGQKARINLARAVYKEADIYLLDDPLSAVDTHVGKHLFDLCINGILKQKTVILITHQLQYLKDVDQIVIVNNGSKEAEGTYSELKETGLDFAKLLDDKSQEQDKHPEGKLAAVRRSSTRSVSSLEENVAEDPEEIKEQKSVGNVSGEVYNAYLRAAASGWLMFIVALFFSLSQIFASASDYFVSYW